MRIPKKIVPWINGLADYDREFGQFITNIIFNPNSSTYEWRIVVFGDYNGVCEITSSESDLVEAYQYIEQNPIKGIITKEVIKKAKEMEKWWAKEIDRRAKLAESYQKSLQDMDKHMLDSFTAEQINGLNPTQLAILCQNNKTI